MAAETPDDVSSITVADWSVKASGKRGGGQGASLVELVLNEVTKRLARGETVELSSTVQTIKSKAKRLGRLKQAAKERTAVTPRRVLVIKPSTVQRETAKPSRSQGQEYIVEQAKGAMTQVVLVPGQDPLVQATVAQIMERIPEIIRARRQEITEKQIETLVDIYVADDPLREARTAIAMDNARERARFISEIACLNSKQVAENAGHRAANASVTASRWKQQGKIFSVPWQGSELYPAFQFRDGQPKPVVAKILAALPKRFSPWQTAFWFTSGNGWLDGATPADCLDIEDAVVAAAQHESEPIIG